ncbi:hypothetical protein LCIT_06980 [Leuconostoc citreum]|uniref:Uncharacterized protein n=1 Tax=Leuconostoc citreum TaxID=33964 RepID=A0A5A5U088_LEUCI|nr:hypothetical protein [Leuconostoc citreum]GDZ83456.1 hypothetical protein LCIT_06980 [Leuconostoc citreum]
MLKFKSKTKKIVLFSLFAMSISINIVSANYILLKFNGDDKAVQNISVYANKLNKTTNALNTISNSFVDYKNNNFYNEIFLNSFKSNKHYLEISKPPYTQVGHIFWSDKYKSLVSTNEQSTYVWIGSTWISADNVNVINNLLNQNVNQLPSGNAATALKINNSGNTFSPVQVSNTTAKASLLGLIGAVISVNQTSIVMNGIHWDENINRMVGSANNVNYIYSINADKYGSYWTDAYFK